MNEYLSVKTLSQYLPQGFHSTPGAIRNLVLRRAIPFRKCAGRLIFLKEEIDNWIKSGEGISFDEVINNSEGPSKERRGEPPGAPPPSVKKPTRRGER